MVVAGLSKVLIEGFSKDDEVADVVFSASWRPVSILLRRFPETPVEAPVALPELPGVLAESIPVVLPTSLVDVFVSAVNYNPEMLDEPVRTGSPPRAFLKLTQPSLTGGGAPPIQPSTLRSHVTTAWRLYREVS